MKIGDNIKFTYKNQFGVQKEEVLILSNASYAIADEDKFSDQEVFEKLDKRLQQYSLEKLLENGYILAARNLLKKYEDATEINIQIKPQQSNNGGGDAGGAIIILAILAIIIAIICFPLLVMLGMRGKLFLKGFYSKCQGEQYNDFVKKYTFVGIGLYALTILLFAIDNIFKLYILSGPAFGILFVGGIAYFVGSLLISKKKFLDESDSFNFIETLKGGFKKEKK